MGRLLLEDSASGKSSAGVNSGIDNLKVIVFTTLSDESEDYYDVIFSDGTMDDREFLLIFGKDT
jgi:hypothetical protein